MVKALILCHYFFNLSDAKGLPPTTTLNLGVRDGPRILSWGGGDKRKKKKKKLNTHPYSIKKLSTKTNTKKSLFLNILRYNHLLKKTKDTKYYCFFIQSSMKRELDALSNLQNHLRLNPN